MNLIGQVSLWNKDVCCLIWIPIEDTVINELYGKTRQQEWGSDGSGKKEHLPPVQMLFVDDVLADI